MAGFTGDDDGKARACSTQSEKYTSELVEIRHGDGDEKQMELCIGNDDEKARACSTQSEYTAGDSLQIHNRNNSPLTPKTMKSDEKPSRPMREAKTPKKFKMYHVNIKLPKKETSGA